jgi:hypothetical protein
MELSAMLFHTPNRDNEWKRLFFYTNFITILSLLLPKLLMPRIVQYRQTVLYILCSFIIIVFAYTQPSPRQIKHNETRHFSGML